MSLTFKSYPSGKVSAGHIRKTYKIGAVKPIPLSEDQAFSLNQFLLHGLSAATPTFSDLDTFDKPRAEAASPRSQRGVKGITSGGAQLVKDAVFLLEKEFGPGRLTFFTGTLHPSSELLTRWTRERWSRACILFKKRIAYHLKEAGLPPHIIGVTELQESRSERTGELAYHVHAVWVGRHRMKTWSLSVQLIEKCWNECFNYNLCNGNDNAKVNATCNVQRIRKSACSYLGKYLSKGRKFASDRKSELTPDQVPASWYLCTASLLRNVRRSTIRLYGDAAEFAVDFLKKNEGEFLRYHRGIYWTAPDGVKIPVGWVGWLKVPWDKIF